MSLFATIKNSRWSGILLIGTLLLAWEILSRAEIVSSAFFPPFSTVVLTLAQMIFIPETWVHVGSTLVRCMVGFCAACAIGIPLGVLMGRSKRMHNLLQPLVEIFRPIPSAAIIPVAIVWLGIYDAMKVFVVTYACLWPVLINSLDGVRGIDPVLIETGKTFRLSRMQFLLRIVIPAASPLFITGMRISLAIALLLSITVEMIMGGNGIGFSILDAERSFQHPRMYAWIVLIGLLGYMINEAFLRLSSVLVKWHHGHREVHL